MSVKTISVDSSVFHTIKYCVVTQRLSVTFNSGSIYVYYDVPAQEVTNLTTLTGTYFSRFIRSNYEYQRIA